MTSITCPCCQLTSRHSGDIANGYCTRCHWWTSDPALAGYHFALPCEHRGQGVQLPPLEPRHRYARIIERLDPPPFVSAMYLPRPGTLLEISGGMRPNRRPRWRRLLWSWHIRRIAKQVRRIWR